MMSFKARERELTLMTCYEIENFSRKVEARVSDRDLENRVEAAFFFGAFTVPITPREYVGQTLALCFSCCSN